MEQSSLFSYLEVIGFLPTWVIPVAKVFFGENSARNYVISND